MRQIGSIEDPRQVEQFAAYLITLGIACSVDTSEKGFVIWIHNEDRLAEARDELARYRAEPNHDRYRDAIPQAAAVIREKHQQADEIRSRTVDVRERWNQPAVNQAPATFGLMALMIVVAVLTGLNPREHQEFLLRMLFSTDGTMNQIWAGQVWRLVSPIFLHFGIVHIFFNFMALRDLGLLVESRIGTPKYFGMVLLIGVISNWVEFKLGGHLLFGGMSGVIYGLFGYAWVRGRLDPDSGLGLNPTSVTYVIGWFVLCWIGVLGNIANWAHTGGLVVGAALGAIGPMIIKPLLRK